MIKIMMMKINLFVYLLVMISSACFAQRGKLIVIVQGIDVRKGGEISTGIFVKENFPKVGRQLLGSVKKVTGTTMEVVFDQVTPGSYGVVSFQDVDKNKNLKTNVFGFPTEPIGFSRDAKIKFGPPDFEDARITIEADQTLTIKINLK